MESARQRDPKEIPVWHRWSKIDTGYADERGRHHKRVIAFEGVLPHLERRYRETESNYVRDDLARYLSNAT